MKSPRVSFCALCAYIIAVPRKNRSIVARIFSLNPISGRSSPFVVLQRTVRSLQCRWLQIMCPQSIGPASNPQAFMHFPSFRSRSATIGVVGALAAIAIAAIACAAPEAASIHSLRTGTAARPAQASPTKTTTPGNLIDHGGAVVRTSTISAIFWGPTANFPSDALPANSQDVSTGLPQELSGFSGSGYLGVANQYMRNSIAATTFGRSYFDGSAPPKNNPSISAIGGEVAKLVGAQNLQPNGIYVVYTSNDGANGYCAWHDQASVNGVTFQIAYVPNTSGVALCDPGMLPGAPNRTEGTRSMADSTAHELMEAITDPKPGASWVDKNGSEIGDKCETATESLVPLTGSTWQLQPEWSNLVSGCASA